MSQRILLTAAARALLARKAEADAWRGDHGYRYPEYRLVYAPRKAGIAWIVRHRRRNVSEHKTKAAALAALQNLSGGGGTVGKARIIPPPAAAGNNATTENLYEQS
jgi:hypothetical protein